MEFGFENKKTEPSYKYHPNGDIDYLKTGFTIENKTPPYEFEKIDWKSWGKFTQDNWHFSIYATAVYIFVVFGIKYLMKSRKPFQLKNELFLWNSAIGLYSVLGFSRLVGGFLGRVLGGGGGFYPVVCTLDVNDPLMFGSLVFLLSKYVELGDTIFIVLRKKPLQFIQWYHHIVTLILGWATYGYFEPLLLLFGILNLGVHSLMYPYFALKALDIKIPREIAKLITTAQLAQMFIGLGANSYTTYLYYSGTAPCLRHPTSIKLFFFVYGTFVILFGNLYYKIVFSSRRKQIKGD